MFWWLRRTENTRELFNIFQYLGTNCYDGVRPVMYRSYYKETSLEMYKNPLVLFSKCEILRHEKRQRIQVLGQNLSWLQRNEIIVTCEFHTKCHEIVPYFLGHFSGKGNPDIFERLSFDNLWSFFSAYELMSVLWYDKKLCDFIHAALFFGTGDYFTSNIKDKEKSFREWKYFVKCLLPENCTRKVLQTEPGLRSWCLFFLKARVLGH